MQSFSRQRPNYHFVARGPHQDLLLLHDASICRPWFSEWHLSAKHWRYAINSDGRAYGVGHDGNHLAVATPAWSPTNEGSGARRRCGHAAPGRVRRVLRVTSNLTGETHEHGREDSTSQTDIAWIYLRTRQRVEGLQDRPLQPPAVLSLRPEAS